MPELQDGLTIGEVFAAAVASHGDRPFLAVPPNESAATCRRASRSPTARPASRIAELAAAYRGAGYGARPPRRDAAREPARARPAQAGAQQPRRLLRADQPRLPRRPRSPICSSTAEPDLILTLGRARRPRSSEALAHSRHQPPVVVSDGVRRGTLPRRVARRRRRHRPRPRRPPASSTPPAPPAGPRAACCRTATRSACGAWYAVARRRGRPAPGAGPHLQSAAALSRQRRRRLADGRDLRRATARSSPTASIRSAGGARSPRPAPPSSTIWRSSRPCC